MAPSVHFYKLFSNCVRVAPGHYLSPSPYLSPFPIIQNFFLNRMTDLSDQPMVHGSHSQPGPLPQPKVSPTLQHIIITWGALRTPPPQCLCCMPKQLNQDSLVWEPGISTFKDPQLSTVHQIIGKLPRSHWPKTLVNDFGIISLNLLLNEILKKLIELKFLNTAVFSINGLCNTLNKSLFIIFIIILYKELMSVIQGFAN